MNKVFFVLLAISILLVFPSEAGNSDISEVGGEGGPIGLGSYGDYIEIVGDGHMHSNYSGRPSTVAEMAQKAQERGLDWIFITDYDTVAAKNNCTEETNSTFITGLGEEVRIIEGGEYTNEIIAWGIDSLVSGQTDANYTVGDVIDEIHEQGGLAYIPHPFAPEKDDNYTYFGVYDDFDAMSIYHGYAGFNNNSITAMDYDALVKWDEYLNNGFRKTALGESDCKNAANTPDYGDLFNMRGAIGYPRNYIYAKEFSVRGIIEAVRHGRVYVTDGPTMNFTIDGYIMGDTIYSDTAKSLNIEINGNAIESSEVQVISNGVVIYTQAVPPGPFSVSICILPVSADAYFRAEIRTFNGNLFKGETNISFSNPIYFDLSPYEEKPLPPTNLEAMVSGSDIVLNWTPSVSSDVMHYNIYRSNTINGFDFTYPFALTSKTSWTDFGAGEGDTNNYYYLVRAVNKQLYNDTNMVKAGKHVISLNKGWNMLSTPLVLSKTRPDDVLQTVNDTCEIAQYYDASDGLDHWKDTKIGDLTEINNTMGFWLYLNASDHLITAGRVPNSTVINLFTGWNLVGYPSYRSSYLDQALSGVSWKNVQFYDSTDATGDYWKHNSTTKPSHLNDLDWMTTGGGYWIFVTGDCTWTVFM
ncbi:MAG: CehA/McbA family metallohydrolase [Thermoplasmata archaeon]